MCGIVGYIGGESAQNILLSGLTRLEYRGYDSAGIVSFDAKGRATLLRAKGKVSELGKKLHEHPTNDNQGIGHTRWATHGAPSKRNAHPHAVGDIYLVHNGIIENYQDLKATLLAHDYDFKSDTDSEVLAALIDHIQQTTGSTLFSATAEALSLVVGSYGIAVVNKRAPDEIIVARKGSPLIVGIGAQELFIASDATALIGHTDQVVYLQDNEIGICTRDGLQLFSIDAQPKNIVVETIETTLGVVQKQGFDHFLLKEIFEQPHSLHTTLSGRIIPESADVKLGGLNLSDQQLRAIKHVIIVGCGTAYYAGMLGSYLAEQFLDDVTFSVEIASELRYRSFNTPSHTVALIVSQSGETADTRACLQELKQRGIFCIGIVNSVGSTIAREVDGGIYVRVGPEISVASTKAFTSQVAAILLFFLAMGATKGLSKQRRSDYIEELSLLPSEIQKVLDAHNDEIQRAAQHYASYEKSLYIGRDSLYPVALEGALKLKEVSYIHTEAHAGGELKHGSIALVDDTVFLVHFLQDNWLYEKSLNNLVEVQARGGHVLVVTDSAKRINADTIIRVNTKLSLLTPLVFNVVAQLFAYHVAVAKGGDVDQPRNLAKSVTVE